MAAPPGDQVKRGDERLRNPQGEGGRLREELITAAGRLLLKDGNPNALSLRAVAREAGVSAPSVYLQFENKDALLRAVVNEHFAALQRATEEQTASGLDPVSRLYAGCLAYCRFAIEQPGAYRVIFETPLPSWPEIDVDERPGMAAFMVLVDSVANCISAGVAEPDDPFRIATDIWTSMHGMVSLRQRLPGFPWSPVEEQLTGIISAFTGIDRAVVGGSDTIAPRRAGNH